MKQPLDKLAEQISRGIDKLSIHMLRGDDLAILWGGDMELAHDEKRLRAVNFARHYGFFVVLNEEMTVALFKKVETIP